VRVQMQSGMSVSSRQDAPTTYKQPASKLQTMGKQRACSYHRPIAGDADVMGKKRALAPMRAKLR
jgi:hypothetical protein